VRSAAPPGVARPASAQWAGAQFRADAVSATFSSTDPSTGYVTEVLVYADDQSYKEQGDNGPAERISSINVTIYQYDPICIGDPEQAFDAAWLNTPLTVIEWTPDGATGSQDIMISLTWTATSDIYTIHENWLRNTPPIVQTGHINATQRDTVATGSYANIGDFQQVTT
jgi:hypothetical protein